MKTFENLHLEFNHQPDEKQRQIDSMLSFSLMDRINMRGIREQYTAKMGIVFWDDQRINTITNKKNISKNTNFWYLYKYPSIILCRK